MAFKFSVVKLATDEKSKEFLIGGIPTEHTDLIGWRKAEEFLERIDRNSKVQLSAKVYAYGDGEKINAEPAEVAYIIQQMERRPNFLQDRCKSIGSVNFNFDLSEDGEISDVKKLYPKGTRIMLAQMYDDTKPVEMGTKGTVDYVDDAGNNDKFSIMESSIFNTS